MAAGGRRRMRGGGKMARAGGADLMKPRGRIHDLVKPGAAKSKPSSVDSNEEAWIYIRGCRIERVVLHFNSQREVYVPDSEDEEDAPEVPTKGVVGVDLAPALATDGDTGVELAPALAADVAAGVDAAPAMAAERVAGVDLDPAEAADGAAGVEMKPEVAARLAKKVLGEDVHPEVVALLAEVLSKMEPLYHECFIDMYKLMLVLSSFYVEVKIILFMWSIDVEMSLWLMVFISNKNCNMEY